MENTEAQMAAITTQDQSKRAADFAADLRLLLGEVSGRLAESSKLGATDCTQQTTPTHRSRPTVLTAPPVFGAPAIRHAGLLRGGHQPDASKQPAPMMQARSGNNAVFASFDAQSQMIAATGPLCASFDAPSTLNFRNPPIRWCHSPCIRTPTTLRARDTRATPGGPWPERKAIKSITAP